MLRNGRMFVLIVLTLSYMIGELTHFIVMITGSQLANDIGKQVINVFFNFLF